MIVEIKKTESGCTYKFDDSAYLGKSEKEHEKVINDVSTVSHIRIRPDADEYHVLLLHDGAEHRFRSLRHHLSVG